MNSINMAPVELDHGGTEKFQKFYRDRAKDAKVVMQKPELGAKAVSRKAAEGAQQR